MLPFFSTQRKPGWLAILPQSGQVTLAHVVRDRDSRPEVRLLDSFALENGEHEALQRLRVTRQLKTYACTTLMDNGEYNLTLLGFAAAGFMSFRTRCQTPFLLSPFISPGLASPA